MTESAPLFEPAIVTEEARFRKPVSLLSVIGVFLFLLPFVKISCNNYELYSYKGIDLVFGLAPREAEFPFGDDKTSGSQLQKEKGREVNSFAILAFTAALASVALSFGKTRNFVMAALVTNALAALSLIVLMIDLSMKVKKQAGADISKFTEALKIQVGFSFWYYITIVIFIAACYLNYRRGLPMSKTQPVADLPEGMDRI